MNKTGFIEELQRQTGLDKELCAIANDVFEAHFIFSKRNKPAVVADLSEKLAVDLAAAEDVYETGMEIIRKEKNLRLRRPFGKR